MHGGIQPVFPMPKTRTTANPPPAARTPATPRPRNAERTRNQLLKAAIALFSAKGYHGVSVDSVVATAKVNKRMVYHYFGSKEKLYLAALESVFSRLGEATPPDTEPDRPADEKLRSLLGSTFDFLDANPEFIRLLLWENLEHGRHLASNPERLGHNPFMEHFGHVVQEGIDAGLFRSPHDMRHLLVNFIGLCFIYYSNRHSLAVSLKLKDSPQERQTRLAQTIDLVFNGLLPRS